jgi:hypothetical protein
MVRSCPLVVLGLAGIGWVLGCGSSEETTSRRPWSATGGSSSTAPIEDTLACADGAIRKCSVDLGTYNNVHSCFVGCQFCQDGSWGDCVDCPDAGGAAGAPGIGGAGTG